MALAVPQKPSRFPERASAPAKLRVAESKDCSGYTGCGKTPHSCLVFPFWEDFQSFRPVEPRFPLFVLYLEAVFPASRHTSALLGQRFNRNQPPHAHQVLRRDAQLPEPVHPIQSAQFHLARLTIQLRPAKDALDQLTLALTDRAPWVLPLLVRQAVLGHIAPFACTR